MMQKLILIWKRIQITFVDNPIQKERLQFALSKILLIVSCVLFFSSSQIANYHTTVNEAWQRWNFLMYINFTLMFFALRKEVKNLITNIGYKIFIYLLVNYFFDKYFGYTDWTWNDFITVALIFVELFFKIKKNRWQIFNLM